MKRLYLLLATTVLLCACHREKNPVAFGYGQCDFGIYFLADEKLKMKDVYNKDLSELKLAINPWLDANDIRLYDWSSHCIYLKKDKTHFFPGWKKGSYFNFFPDEWFEKPIVFVANGQKRYLSYLYCIGAKMEWHTPNLADYSNALYPLDVIYSEWQWLYRDNPQDDPIIKEALVAAGLYHGGISVKFDPTDINALRVIENADTATLSYQYTLTNIDEDDLYVLDPDKMGSDLFHYFTHGPVLKNLTTNNIYDADKRKRITLPSPEFWLPEWYSKIDTGRSMKRTVLLKGYSHFANGEYIVEFRFGAKKDGMEKEAREIADGRYWLGPTRSNIFFWNFKPDD